LDFVKRRFQTTYGFVGILLLFSMACQPPPLSKQQLLDVRPGTQARAQAADSRVTSGPRRDLSQDEAAGGHILRKHVGCTDEQLRERLEHERHISAASTYTDRETAERVVGSVLQQQHVRIQHWSEREGGHPNLVLDYDGDPQHPIGRSLRRGESESQPCSRALVVLKWAGPNDFYVLTSYPECRR
jgi:Bacterial CdiA-CT RNAse A domain